MKSIILYFNIRLSSLIYNTVAENGIINSAVEKCDCGDRYSGNSCQVHIPTSILKQNIDILIYAITTQQL